MTRAIMLAAALTLAAVSTARAAEQAAVRSRDRRAHSVYAFSAGHLRRAAQRHRRSARRLRRARQAPLWLDAGYRLDYELIWAGTS